MAIAERTIGLEGMRTENKPFNRKKEEKKRKSKKTESDSPNGENQTKQK